MDREAWHTAIHGVAKSRTRLSDWTELNLNIICNLQVTQNTREDVHWVIHKYHTILYKTWASMEQFPMNTEKLLYLYWLIFIVIMFGNNPGMLSDQNENVFLSSRVRVMVQYNLKLNSFYIASKLWNNSIKITTKCENAKKKRWKFKEKLTNPPL